MVYINNNMDFIGDNSLITSFKNSCTINDNSTDKEIIEEELCGICGDIIDETTDIDILKCGHKYCHTCIYIWFESIEKKKNVMSTVSHRQCPYCCKQSDYLKLRPNEKAIKYVHNIISSKSNKSNVLYCCAIKKNGKKCKYKAKYNENNKGYCGVHYGTSQY